MTKVVLSTSRWQTVCWAVIQNCVRNAFICVSYLTRTSWNIRIPILYYIIFRGHSFIHEHVWFCSFYVICLIFYPFSLNTKFISRVTPLYQGNVNLSMEGHPLWIVNYWYSFLLLLHSWIYVYVYICLCKSTFTKYLTTHVYAHFYCKLSQSNYEISNDQ